MQVIKINKLCSLLILAAGLLLASSCEKFAAQDEVYTMTYTVSCPTTKALGQGEAANYVWYGQYRLDGSLAKSYEPVPVVDGKAVCPVEMVREQSYDVVFVAQHYDASGNPTYEINAAEAQLLMPDAAVANSDNYDLFCGIAKAVSYGDDKTRNIPLARKVANFIFTATQESWDAAATKPDASEITINGAAASYNLLEETISDTDKVVHFTKAEKLSESLMLGAAFCLVNGDVDVQLTLYKGNTQTKTYSVDDVKAETNRRTNIIIGL